MTYLKPLNEPYSKDEIKNHFQFKEKKNKIFRIGLSNPKLSFIGAIYYGPKFMNLNHNKKMEFINKKIREIYDKITPTNWFGINDGKIAIRRINEMMQLFHLNLSIYLKEEDKREEFELNNFNLLFLEILSILIPSSSVEENILGPFRDFEKDFLFEEKNMEIIYYELQKKYSELYKNLIMKEFQSLENQLIECSEERKKKFLETLYKTTDNLFEFICYKTTEDFKNNIIDSDEWLDVFDWFYLYQFYEPEYNILLIDATTLELWKEIHQVDYIDTEKKCVIVLYFPDSHYECLFFTQNLPNLKKNFSFFGCQPNESNDILKTKYRELVKQFHPDTFNESLSETEKIEKLKVWHQIQENYDFIENVEEQSFSKEYENSIDFDVRNNKGIREESLYFFDYKHEFIQYFLTR